MHMAKKKIQEYSVEEFGDKHVRSEEFGTPGHFYNPIPSVEYVLSNQKRIFQDRIPKSIDINSDGQFQLLTRFRRHFESIFFPAYATEGLRYYEANDYFKYADSIFFHCFLMEYRPSRYFEIGSGFSSALAFDINERLLGNSIDFTFIEPYPETLKSLLMPSDDFRLIERDIQDVNTEIFQELEKGDILFIDTSHVMKTGSDVNHILFEILPVLKPGVIVQIHDIFHFQYPIRWIKEGRAWNEVYGVLAFLSYNSKFKISFLNQYVTRHFSKWLEEHYPNAMAGHGGASLWLEVQ